ncbi:MAG: hypothetical protein HXY38_10845 [Chloroflexi bacterium]|nr:hypothetical protein [Chloroflexota bacterium]
MKINWVDFDVEDGAIKLDDLQKALERKPKLVAVGYALNSLGTFGVTFEYASSISCFFITFNS